MADAVFVNENGEEVAGSEALRETLNAFMAMKPNLRMNKSKTIASGDLASTVADWTLTGTGPDGSPVEMTGRGYDVMQRQADGSWKMAIDSPWGTAVLA